MERRESLLEWIDGNMRNVRGLQDSKVNWKKYKGEIGGWQMNPEIFMKMNAGLKSHKMR